MKFYINYSHNMKPIYPFEGSDQIDTSYSQVLQDMFVLSVLSGKRNGTYFEIGAGDPWFINNTYLLTKYGWSGVSLDCIQDYKISWAEKRKNDKFILCDALTVDYKNLLTENYNETVIDYLQCDIEPSINTLTALKRLPHSDYRFRVITFETDYYAGGNSGMVREESRKFLTDLGYTLVVSDVVVNKINPFEDWYVDINLVNHEVANNIQRMAQHTSDPINLLFK